MTKKTHCLAVVALFCLWMPAWVRAQSMPEWQYVVRAGDNPWRITERLLDGMKYWPLVQKHNGITDPLRIPPGTVLRIPIDWLRTEPGFALVQATSREGCLVTEATGAGHAAKIGDKLAVGVQLRSTPGGGCTLKFLDGSRILLHEDGELRLERMRSYAMSGMHDIATRLLRGRVESQVAPAAGPASRFEIQSPQGVTSVRGTRYRVASQDTGARAEVLEGQVGVRNDLGEVAVDAGMGTVFSRSAAPAPPVQLLPAPDLAQLPASVRAAQPPLTFPTVAGARAYRQQFAADPSFDLPLSDQRTELALLQIPSLPEGEYHYRVRAIDALDLEGHDASATVRIEHLLAAPTGCSPRQGEKVIARSFMAQCTAVPEARWYRLQLARDDSFVTPQADLLQTQPGAALSLDVPGRYFWRLAAIDAAGRTGDFTAAMAVQRALDPPSVQLLAFGRESLTFGWQAQSAGQRYRLQLAAGEDFASPVQDVITIGNRLVLPRPEAPGRYAARVGLLEAEGEAAMFGPPHSLYLPPVGNLEWLPPLGVVLIFAL